MNIPSGLPSEPLLGMIVALGDDELVLGHRNSEWTGFAPILEEDIAFSNIAQDELGHSLAWFSLHEQLTGKTPDWMAFERNWRDFACCRLVAYPKGDFAYTVVRQFFFDAAEQVRMKSFAQSSFDPLRQLSVKILAEEAYHLMHSQGLVERLGDGTEESHRRMQAAAETAFPQSLGLFEDFPAEADLVKAGVVKPSRELQEEWLTEIMRVLTRATLVVPVRKKNGTFEPECSPDLGGRTGRHTDDLRQLVSDLQHVYQLAPGQPW
ncbi:MAG: phenylacetate-CoA oxygenase subunit PaaC [Ignavibacteriales bacterium]|nr:phenylacetate-CoA oxygenase subunit PaaC [Ignavibacteriales bacterium]